MSEDVLKQKRRKLPRIIRDKQFYTKAAYVMIIGFVGTVLSFGKLFYSEYHADKLFTIEDCLALCGSLFLIALFLPLATTLYLCKELADYIKNNMEHEETTN